MESNFFHSHIDPRLGQVDQTLARLGLSRRWLAREMRLSHTTINNWLSGQASPRDDTMVHLMLAALDPINQARTGVSLLRAANPVLMVRQFNGVEQVEVEYEEIPDWGSFERWPLKIQCATGCGVLRENDIAIMEDRLPELSSVVYAVRRGEACLRALRGSGKTAQLWSLNRCESPISVIGWNIQGVCVGRIRYPAEGVRQVTEFRGGLLWTMLDWAI